MFEGLVRQLLAGYLGRYVKGLQLKIGLWNEEVLLENVELILEAFDYLQLPFALKQGRVGKLSIKIPWKKLGWDPIIILLEDVFICACQRDDDEWNRDAVEKREIAAKKAKLATAELAKLSRRVCDNQAGRSFISYITAKILDGIQVSLRNVHVIYIDNQNDTEQFIFGLRFSSLTIMTDSRAKQNSFGSSTARFRGNQVNKIVEILSLGIYCNSVEDASKSLGINNEDEPFLCYVSRIGFDGCDYVLQPFDVVVSLGVNKFGKLEHGGPQYTVNAELTSLVMSLNEVQLQRILVISDYLSTCTIRERYGRYRPWHNPLSRKLDGWQRMWWHYAQESILSDVRRKLRKSSWSSLGHRISCRRKYVNLYKRKLEFLHQEQAVNEDILKELEQMERESEIEDILSYRSIAEHQLQEYLSNSLTPRMATNSIDTKEKSQNDELSSHRPRGWLNWLSLGMLGAGGTTDSSHFAGVVSDEIIKDIYEATEFHPVPSFEGGLAVKDKFCLSSFKFIIHQIMATLGSKKYARDITHVNFDEVSIQSKLWEDSVTILFTINSVKLTDPSTENVILITKETILEESLLNHWQPFISSEIKMSPLHHDLELSIKVVLQPFEVTYDSNLLLYLMDFYRVLKSVQFQHERVVSSLNRFENFKARLWSKAEYIFSSRTKMTWDVNFNNVIIKVPWRNQNCELYTLVLELGTLLFKSVPERNPLASTSEHQCNNLLSSILSSTSPDNLLLDVKDLYDYFMVDLTGLEVNVMVPNLPQALCVLERSNASVSLGSCMFLDESMLKQLEVHSTVSSLNLWFSSKLYDALITLKSFLDVSENGSELVDWGTGELDKIPSCSNAFQYSVFVDLEQACLHVNLENDGENSLVLVFYLSKMDIQYGIQESMEEFCVSLKTLNVSTSSSGVASGHILCSSRNASVNSAHQPSDGVECDLACENCDEKDASADGCFFLHCQATGSIYGIHHKYTICLSDVDLHFYPRIVGLLLEFHDNLSRHGLLFQENLSRPDLSVFSNGNFFEYSQETFEQKQRTRIGLQKYGFSNYYETGSIVSSSIPLDHFPFVTISNSGSLNTLESSLLHPIPEWRTLHVKDRRSVRSQKSITRKRSRMCTLSTLKSILCSHTTIMSESLYDSHPCVIDFHLNGIRAHFHDSSCILASLTLPSSVASVFLHGTECWDVLGSVDGLTLSSSWSTPRISELLWGPVSPESASILNIRVRKGKGEVTPSKIEICIGIQHVCCNLSSEFLAMLIGYFSLPDWSSSSHERLVTKNHESGNVSVKTHGVIYKFEVLDSLLILPMESSTQYSLQLRLPQLYCSFVPISNSIDVVKDIPLDCVISSHCVADAVDFINLFGRGISLSLLLLEDNGQLPFKLDKDTSLGSIPLVEALDMDLWVRIPTEIKHLVGDFTVCTYIMMRVNTCQLSVEEDYFLCGLESVMLVTNQLSRIGVESQAFTSDVLQFMQLKERSNEGNTVILEDSSNSSLEAKFCINALSIKLCQSRGGPSISSEVVTKADMQLKLAASFKNDVPLCIDVDISSLVVYAFHSSVILGTCSSGDSVSSHLNLHFSKSERGENQLLVSAPTLDIWLHLPEWSKVIELLRSYTRHSGCNSSMVVSTESSGSDSQIDPKSGRVSNILKLENVTVIFHFPIWIEEESLDKCVSIRHEMPIQFPFFTSGENSMFFKEKCGKYIAFTLESRFIELVINGSFVRFNFNVEKTRGVLEEIENQTLSSLPFFQISQVNVEGEFCERLKIVHVSADVHLETIDIWLSHHIFCFWCDVRSRVPETTSSQSPLCSMAVNLHLRKASLLLSDGKLGCNGPIMEIFMRNLLVHISQSEYIMEGSVGGDLQVNYNNIHKVMWEPFIEPWSFQLRLVRKCEQNALLNTTIVTDIHLKSVSHLNLNFTEPLIEAIFRGYEMTKDAWDQIGARHQKKNLGSMAFQASDNVYTRRFAPYILQNDTSVPLLFWVSHGSTEVDDIGFTSTKQGNTVQPGSSVAIYIDETPEELIFRFRQAHSSERLNEKNSGGVAHNMISIQLDGTTGPSLPMSMDLVGLSCFEVDFSKPLATINLNNDDSSSRYNRKREEQYGKHTSSGFVVPVVFEVSIQRYSKLIRLYSTVILVNATSVPLELRFDIPFGVSPKVLDPIYPGQELPLPVHLAEAGRMRWRPLGTNYLWSEAHPLTNVISQESRLGFLRSFVCYPSHPSSDPFRCCIAVQDIKVSFTGTKRNSTIQSVIKGNPIMCGMGERLIHNIRLTTPLLVKSYLPEHLSLTIESGGVTRSVSLSEVNTASVFHIDSTHDLGIVLHMHGFKPSTSKFPRAETFATMGKLSESKFSLCETLSFYPDASNGPICVTLEKVMDACCGARELCISIPFLLYNCTGLPLMISDCDGNKNENPFPILSCYCLITPEQLLSRKHGLAFVSSEQHSSTTDSNRHNFVDLFSKKHTISSREGANMQSCGNFCGHFPTTNSMKQCVDDPDNHETAAEQSFHNLMNEELGRSQSNLSIRVEGGPQAVENGDSRKVKAFMYSPPCSSISELMVSLSTYLPECCAGIRQNSLWSSPFFLVPASGSSSVVIPEPCTAGAFIISVTSSPAAGELAGRTRTITFQPRYVISNACNKEICYKQKGTSFFHRLGIGQHSHLHWADTTRELLVSIRFNEPGWQWSGSFLPNHLGDAQVKMHNYVSGALNMVRVEVQNADVSIKDEKIVGSSNGNSGTYLIFLSDDNTGFMPYRVDNFSMERLRIFQQKCETFETIVHPYTSCPYAWDEPCYPHRLFVEVPGERAIGSYSLDDVKEYTPVCLSRTSEKPERRFSLSVHAEGAVKVLSIVDTNHHVLKEVKEIGFPGYKGTKKLDQERHADYTERITLHMSFIGISLMDSSPQELVFACARDTKIEIQQSLDQQKISFQISSLQIDNQLRNTPYPVILSFEDNRNEAIGPTTSKCICEPIFCLTGAKWRNGESSLVSFEYIKIRLAPLRIELEEEVLINVLEFVRAVTSNLQSTTFRHQNSEVQTPDNSTGYGAHVHDCDSTSNIASSQIHSLKVSNFFGNHRSGPSLPSVVPIGAPWQQIFLLARRQKKIYVEVFDLPPIKLTVSFSSAPWMPRNEGHRAAESLVHISSSAVQRGLMALVDVEGVPIYLRQLTISHHMASWESIQEMLIRHYTRQLLHEIYKVFGSAGVIGNPMGFARNVGLGIKDFLSVPAKGIFQSPSGLVTGMAKGTKSLISNTVYAVSNAATQFSKAAHKGIVAFTFDEQAAAKIEEQKGLHSHSKGVLNEFLEGLTGLLQSPIRGAEKHGLPGVLSGIAMGATGLVARPVASILEVTGKTAQSIRNRSSPHQPYRFRVRFPRPLSRELPLLPYSWEDAIGISLLLEADDSKLKDETFVMCKALKQAGKFIIITKRLVLVFSCRSLVGFGSPDFVGVADPEWIIEMKMGLEGVIHIDREVTLVNIVGSSAGTPTRSHQLKQSSMSVRQWGPPASVPLFQTSVELPNEEEAEDVLQILWSTIEQGKEIQWGEHVLHRSNIR